jgi:hypothetical protein
MYVLIFFYVSRVFPAVLVHRVFQVLKDQAEIKVAMEELQN